MKTCASSLELLESRIAPANIVCTVIGHTLHIVGDADGNSVTVDGNADPTTFLITSTSDTVNGGPGATGFTTPAGITSIAVKLLGGDDTLTFSNAIAAIHLQGGLTIDGGSGANEVEGTDLTVDKSIAITNGDAGAGTHENLFYNLNVGGSVTIHNGTGDTENYIDRLSAGLSVIRGNLVIINGTGVDYNDMEDMNVGGNITIKNGHGNGITAGYTEIYNYRNTTGLSVIKGNVSVSYLDGDINYDGIWDYNILGNVTFNHGSGNTIMHFDGYSSNLTGLIRGNLTIKGTGATTIDVGTEYEHTGLIVGKGVTIVSGDGGDSITFNRLQVGGATKLTYGKDDNTTQIDDSVFVGAFKLTGGAAHDTINIETGTGTALPTFFEKAVTLSVGAGDDAETFAGADDAGQLIYAYSTLIIHAGVGTNSTSSTPAQIIFPFGGEPQTVF